MASENDVRHYLAYWFQAGKRVVMEGGHNAYCPSTVLQSDRFSDEFERCWAYLRSSQSGECYLEGTQQTIQDLLSSSWDVMPCARCEMPVPVLSMGVSSAECPCNDLPNWPNADIPKPRSPVSTSHHLNDIRSRLTHAATSHPLSERSISERSNWD